MYAVIATGGKQYKVSEGDVIRVEKLGAEADEKLHLTRSFVSDSDVKVEILQLQTQV